MHLLRLHRRARLSRRLRLGEPRSAGLHELRSEKPAAQEQEGQAMTGKAIAGTRHAWATVYCRGCRRIVSYQAEMVTTQRRGYENRGENFLQSEPHTVDVVECSCGALIELGGR